MAEAQAPASSTPVRGGKIGKYEIISLLSVGGMAELFLAFTKGPGGFKKYVVVKQVLPDIRNDDQFRKMFLDEARITAQLSHQNIAQTYDLGDGGPDGLYLAMEFIAGQNLNQVVNACAKAQVPLPLGFSAAVAKDLALALHYAHSLKDESGESFGVIHRDVAHKNVMVTFDGVVKLLDFGIAKAKGRLEQTRTGMVKGTTGYMSPEQVMGQPLDGRSDLFAVGVMLHELLTGRRLFSGKTELEEMKLILEAPIHPPHELIPAIPAALSDVTMKALARDPAQRFQTGREMARAIEKAAGSMLFEEDEAAGFMRGLFEDKVRATRLLLESAGKASPEIVTALNTLQEMPAAVAPPPAPAPPRVSGSGAVPPRASASGAGKKPKLEAAGSSGGVAESTVLKPSARNSLPGAPRTSGPGSASAMSAKTEPLEPVRVSRQTQPPGPAFTSDEVEVPPARKLTLLWVLCGLIFLASLAFFAWMYSQSLEAEAPELEHSQAGPPPPLPVAIPSPQLAPRDPTAPPPTIPDGSPQARGDGAAPGEDVDSAESVSASDVAAGRDGEKPPSESDKPPAAKGKRPPAVEKGSMTLVTLPASEVYLGKKKIGTTPLFKVPLPEGTHLLRLKGPDGKFRKLSVPVKAGKVTPFKLDLKDLPPI